MDIHPPILVAELTLDDGSDVYAGQDVRAPSPASRGRITVAIPVSAVPTGRRIIRIVVRNESGIQFRRQFIPTLDIPPEGLITVSFGLEDAFGEWCAP